MYYDECLINGVLHCRTTPNGEWVPVSSANLTTRLQEAEALNDRYRRLVRELERVVCTQHGCPGRRSSEHIQRWIARVEGANNG